MVDTGDKADDSADKTQTNTTQQTDTKDDDGRKPSEYELKLRKENEQLRKTLSAKLEAEKKAKEQALEEQGKFKELYESVKPQFDTLTKEKESLAAQLTAIEEASRAECLERFPEAKRAVVKDLPFATLKELAKLESGTTEKARDTTRTVTTIKPQSKEYKNFDEWEKAARAAGAVS